MTEQEIYELEKLLLPQKQKGAAYTDDGMECVECEIEHIPPTISLPRATFSKLLKEIWDLRHHVERLIDNIDRRGSY